jgi:hypothetical protein
MYLRKGFKRLQHKGISEAIESFRTEFGATKGIVHVGYDLRISGNDIVVCVSRNNVKLPPLWENYRIVKYDLSSMRKQSAAILKRLQDEKIDISDPQTQYFYQLMVAGNTICNKLG